MRSTARPTERWFKLGLDFVLLLIIGIPVLLAALGANTFVIILGAIINIALVGYLLYRWDLINILKEAFSTMN